MLIYVNLNVFNLHTISPLSDDRVAETKWLKKKKKGHGAIGGRWARYLKSIATLKL